VDAFLFTRLTPVFVANMSGNLVRLSIATGNDTVVASQRPRLRSLDSSAARCSLCCPS
jgi:uncharacterized membrane protein YoaK (UPF0700 family)